MDSIDPRLSFLSYILKALDFDLGHGFAGFGKGFFIRKDSVLPGQLVLSSRVLFSWAVILLV